MLNMLIMISINEKQQLAVSRKRGAKSLYFRTDVLKADLSCLLLGSLSMRVFEIFILIISNGEKILRNVNAVV